MNEITLENFRCFREKQTARLAPLTLLVGDNSTGKTSFMAMIKALSAIAYKEEIPNFKEPYDLGVFDEIVHFRGGKGGRAKTFQAGIAEARRSNLTYRLNVEFAKRETEPSPTMRTVYCKQGKSWFKDIAKRSGKDIIHKCSFGTRNGHWDVPDRTLADQFTARPFPRGFPVGWLWISYHIDDSEYTIVEGSVQPGPEDLEQLRKLLMDSHHESYRRRVYASGPVRSRPRRTYDQASTRRDPEGDYIPMYLDSIRRDQTRWPQTKLALENFGKNAGIFDEVRVKTLGTKAGGPFQIQVRRFDGRAKGPYRNLIDVGYGVSQVLPIVTELLRKNAPQIFLLQQPEVHLHPSAQAALGSLFCEVAGKGRQLIVETHSDDLLDRVRMDVRDGRAKGLRPQDVSILFFERRNLDVKISSLQVDDQGNIDGAPKSYRKYFMHETRRSLGF